LVATVIDRPFKLGTPPVKLVGARSTPGEMLVKVGNRLVNVPKRLVNPGVELVNAGGPLVIAGTTAPAPSVKTAPGVTVIAAGGVGFAGLITKAGFEISSMIKVSGSTMIVPGIAGADSAGPD
jgi:hypothetical protein